MPRRSQNVDDLRARLAEISGWQTATRDDRQVAQTLYETRSVDRVHALDEAAFFDELFHYIREIGAWPLLMGLEPDHREGALYPFLQFVLFTIMRCVGGVQSMLATHDARCAPDRRRLKGDARDRMVAPVHGPLPPRHEGRCGSLGR